MSDSPAVPPAFLAALKPAVEDELGRRLALEGAPENLARAIQYAVLGGGKRLRPVMALSACRMVSGHIEPALPAAAAVEMIHAYSLVHDDLPCMDDDDMRRGRPTTHRVFGEAGAVLAGDALQALAFECLVDSPVSGADVARMVGVLAGAAGPRGMVGGQALDIEGAATEAAELDEMHAHKTGALFRAAVLLGGIAGGASEALLDDLERYARAFGLVFQISDDLLDVSGDPRKTGRYRGSDADLGRRTYPGVLGVAASRDRMDALVAEGLSVLAPYGDGASDLAELLEFAARRDA